MVLLFFVFSEFFMFSKFSSFQKIDFERFKVFFIVTINVTFYLKY